MATDTTAIDAEDAITNENFITSTAYYALGDAIIPAHCSDNTSADQTTCEQNSKTWIPATTSTRGEYERIAYVGTDRKVYTLSQAIALGATVDQYGNYDYTNVNLANTYTQNEQYYQINSQGFTVKVNVYAQGAKVVNN
jgi:hypothetical protein